MNVPNDNLWDEPLSEEDELKRPAYQHYPGDWHSDMQLQGCSLAARGLWIEMLGLMHMGHPYGHLTIRTKDGVKPVDEEYLASWTGCPIDSVKSALKELENSQVFSRKLRSEIIYSRRMVRDEERRKVAEKNGRRSVDNPNVPRKKRISKGDIPRGVPFVEDEDEDISLNSKVERIYSAYPRKVAKGHALKSIRAAIKKLKTDHADAADWLLQRTEKFAQSEAGNRGKYTPHPATWFNQERYLDDDSQWGCVDDTEPFDVVKAMAKYQ